MLIMTLGLLLGKVMETLCLDFSQGMSSTYHKIFNGIFVCILWVLKALEITFCLLKGQVLFVLFSCHCSFSLESNFSVKNSVFTFSNFWRKGRKIKLKIMIVLVLRIMRVSIYSLSSCWQPFGQMFLLQWNLHMA